MNKPLLPAVEADFDVEPTRVTHTPTGAWWSGYVGRPEPSYRNAGHLDEARQDGTEYDQEAVIQMAVRLLRDRPEAKSD